MPPVRDERPDAAREQIAAAIATADVRRWTGRRRDRADATSARHSTGMREDGQHPAHHPVAIDGCTTSGCVATTATTIRTIAPRRSTHGARLKKSHQTRQHERAASRRTSPDHADDPAPAEERRHQSAAMERDEDDAGPERSGVRRRAEFRRRRSLDCGTGLSSIALWRMSITPIAEPAARRRAMRARPAAATRRPRRP